jgi:hypothetical protein
MDFLNHREGGMVFYQVFLPSPYRNCKRLREFEECNKTLDLVIMSFINKFLSLVLYMSCCQ